MSVAMFANEYLDMRRPEWVTSELIGEVRYDKDTRMVVVASTCRQVLDAYSTMRSWGKSKKP